MNLIQSGFSKREIRAIVPVCSSKISQLHKVLQDGINTLHTHYPPCIFAHALHDNDLDTIKANAKSWEVKDGFPCTHRRQKQYLLDSKLTFTKLYQRQDKIESTNDDRRVISYSRWIQYIHLFFIGLRLTRTTEDVCNYSVRINIQLQRDDRPFDERDHLLLEKQTHMDAAISQRHTVSTFVKEFVKQHAP
jgi:hypothetical protein